MQHHGTHTERGNNSLLRGFTLVEILVSIGILAILSSITVLGMVSYANYQRYAGVVSEIQNELSLARQKTIAAYENAVYGIYIGTTTIEFFEGATPVVGSSNNTIIDLEARGITATSSLSNGLWYLTFRKRTGEASTAGTITLERTDGSASTTIVIHASGLVE